MAQVTIYLDEDTERRARQAAQSAGIPLSRWVVQIIRDRTETAWPESVVRLAGSWPDFPAAEELRSGQAADTRRESF